MNKWVVAGAAAAVGALLFLRKKSGVPPNAQTIGPYAVIGDSLAVGLAGPLKKELAPAEVTGWGVGGSIAAMWTMQVDGVLATKPSTVIVSLGTNDAVSPDALSKFPARIQTIVDKIRAAGVKPVLLATPAQLPNQQAVIAAMAKTGALVLAPSPLPMQPDKIHPTPAGYAQWASEIAGAIT